MQPVKDNIRVVASEGIKVVSEKCSAANSTLMTIGHARWEQWAKYHVSLGRDPFLIAWFDLHVVGASMKGQGWLWSRALMPNSSLNLGKVGYQKEFFSYLVPKGCKQDCSLIEHCSASGRIGATVNGADMSADIQAFIELCGETVPLVVALTSKKKGGAENELEVKIPKTGITYKRKWVSETGDYEWDSIHPTFEKRHTVACIDELKAETVLDLGALNANWTGNTIELVVDLDVQFTAVPKLTCKCPDSQLSPGGDELPRTRERQTKDQLKTMEKLRTRIVGAQERIRETLAAIPSTEEFRGGIASAPRELLEIATMLDLSYADQVFGRRATRQAMKEVSGLRCNSILSSCTNELWLLARTEELIKRDQLLQESDFETFVADVEQFADSAEAEAIGLAQIAADPATDLASNENAGRSEAPDPKRPDG